MARSAGVAVVVILVFDDDDDDDSGMQESNWLVAGL